MFLSMECGQAHGQPILYFDSTVYKLAHMMLILFQRNREIKTMTHSIPWQPMLNKIPHSIACYRHFIFLFNSEKTNTCKILKIQCYNCLESYKMFKILSYFCCSVCRWMLFRASTCAMRVYLVHVSCIKIHVYFEEWYMSLV